jgi:hypothetical protein
VPEGFKVGAAYIEVDADADVAIKKVIGQLKAAKPRLERVADEMGQSIGRKLGSGIEKQMRATKGRLSVLATDIGNTVGSRISTTMNKQLRDAKGRLGNTADGLGAEIGKRVSSSMTKTIKVGDGLNAGAGAAGKRIGKELGDGIDDGASSQISKSPKTKKALDSVAERANAQFKGLVFAGAFAGLPAAAGIAAAGTLAALAVVPAALVGIAATVQAGNEDVAASYTRLGDTALGVLQRASSVLADDLVVNTDRLTAGVRELEPVLTGAFQRAAPAVEGLTDSVLVAADEALPGMITGLTKTEDAMRGVQALAKGAGRGVSDFFTNVSAGSASAATNAGTLGRIIQDVAGFAGSLLANLSNGGTSVLPMFANALSMVYQIVLNLTSGGMGPLVSGVSSFITVVSGALSVVQALSSGVGGLLGPLTALYGGFKAIDLISGGKFGDKLGAQFSGLGDRIKNADGVRGKFQTGMSGLISGAFSPVGLAAGALTLGLGLLGVAHQKAAADAAAQKSREADLAAALRETKGVLDASIRTQAAKSLGEMQLTNTGKNYLQVARELGVSQSDLTSAYLGNAAASNKIKTSLSELVRASQTYSTDGGGAVVETLTGQGFTARDLLEAMGGLNTEYSNAVQRNKDLAAAAGTATSEVGNMTPALAASRQGAAELTTAFTALYNPISSVSDRANALITVLDRLAGRTPSYEESVQSVNDTLRGMADALKSGGNQADGWGAALLNADGTVNTLSKNGSELQNNLVTLQSGFANAGASIEALVRGGMTYDAAAQKVSGTLTEQRNRLVELATTMLGSKEAAEKLADTYGLLPGKVVTTVTDLGTAIKTDSDVGSLFLRLRELPPNTPVRVTSITAEAEQRLRDLGYTVTHMPDGSVLITAETKDAQAGLNAVRGGINALMDKTITITTRFTQIGTPVIPGTQAGFDRATGGPSRPGNYPKPRARASGGPTAVLPGLANARLIGERGPEIDFPTRSTYVATAQQTQRMAGDVQRGTEAMRAAITQLAVPPAPIAAPNITLNVYPAPSMDEDALIAKINRLLARVLKGGQS